MFTIRPFDYSEADYAALHAIDAAAYPEYKMSLADWRHLDATLDPEFLFCREMIERDGGVVAFGEYRQGPWMYHPEKYNVNLVVHPDHEHPDIRPLYFEHVLHLLADRDPLAIINGCLEDRSTHVAFLQQMGFTVLQREPMSELNLGTFDPAAFAPIAEKVRAAHITIVPLADLMESDPDWARKVYDLEWVLSEDVPNAEKPAKPSLEQYQEGTLSGPMFNPAGWFIARAGERYIGMSRFFGTPNAEGHIHFGLTGVIRSYRRQGIATALKLRAIDYARAAGATRVTASNEETNPMYQLNLKLGFQPRPAWVFYQKRLR
jgi:mycothiol synthase